MIYRGFFSQPRLITRGYPDFCGNLGVSENVVYPIVPNGFADHYPVLKNG